MIIGGWRGPGWRVIDAHPRNVRQVRGWISAAITGHGCPVDRGDAALVVSELFTNAVRHGPGGGRVLVGYCLWSRGVRIVVCDGVDAGYVHIERDAAVVTLAGIYLVRSMRRRGLGGAIIQQVIDEAGAEGKAVALRVRCRSIRCSANPISCRSTRRLPRRRAA